jgi:hypothetical protein
MGKLELQPRTQRVGRGIDLVISMGGELDDTWSACTRHTEESADCVADKLGTKRPGIDTQAFQLPRNARDLLGSPSPSRTIWEHGGWRWKTLAVGLFFRNP